MKRLFFIIIILFISGCSSNKNTINDKISEYPFVPPGKPPLAIGGYNVYMGLIHNHSDVSKSETSSGKGTLDQAYTYSRDIAKLDFFGLSDYCTQIDSQEWAETKTIADKYNRDGSFVTFKGFEWGSRTWGHLTVLNTNNYASNLDINTDTFDKICAWIVGNNGIAFFNHPVYSKYNPIENEFNYFLSPPIENIIGMELWNSNSGFNRHYYNDGYYPDGKSVFDEALLRKWHIGASGSDDNHHATWGTDTQFRHAVLAAEKTRVAIMDAFLKRRFYSTLDYNLSLSFKINNQEMGSRISAGNSNLIISAIDSDNEFFSEVKLIKNGELMQQWTPNDTTININTNIITNSNDYYYIIIKQSDGDEAISSPIWIE
jgi:hypothetical protein